MTRKKKSERKRTVERLDRVMSKLVRHKAKDKSGFCTCYTCGKKDRWIKMQNGHFWSRIYLRFRWDFDNCRVQCTGCNIFKSGNYIIYTEKMIKEMGWERYERTKGELKEIYKISLPELRELLEELEKELATYY